MLGGYALAPISIIETDGGLIAFDTQIDDIEGVESWSGSRDFDSHMLLERFRGPKT